MPDAATTSPITEISEGHGRIRIAPWRSNGAVAALTPLCQLDFLTPELIARVNTNLPLLGYKSAITSALTAAEAQIFSAGGFRHREDLALLRRHRWRLPKKTASLECSTNRVQLRKARLFDTEAIIRLDEAAFSKDWQLDAFGLREAAAATVRTRSMVAVTDSRVIGYAVTGSSRRDGFIQRLAVAKAYRQQGIGRGLVVDALTWLRHSLVVDVMVNTQLDNDVALHLYQQLGFELQPHRLSVLSIDL